MLRPKAKFVRLNNPLSKKLTLRWLFPLNRIRASNVIVLNLARTTTYGYIIPQVMDASSVELGKQMEFARKG